MIYPPPASISASARPKPDAKLKVVTQHYDLTTDGSAPGRAYAAARTKSIDGGQGLLHARHRVAQAFGRNGSCSRRRTPSCHHVGWPRA